jgi:V/A-type H+-transporting ATPase subunit B
MACLSRARQVRELADLVGEDSLSGTDRAYLSFAAELEHHVLHQRSDEARTIDETLDGVWRALGLLPRRELTMLPEATLDQRYVVHPDGHPEVWTS